MTDEPDWFSEARRVAAIEHEHLRKQLVALRRNRRTWKRLRMLDVVCGLCGDSLAEVVETKPAPVICVAELAEPTGVAPGKDHILPVRGTGNWTFSALEWPLPDDVTNHVGWLSHCRCRTVSVDGRAVYDALRDATRRLVIR